ncbi:hypothetical protein [Paenibacillus crassostreae]|uniref:Amphi-Trp domain-containing protein n=1 Tax=Paenibacillus crassostreae TaxID=1763538 RepID=A0A167FGC1_9BACL|nr:hypothetical protein [Paenibacillus crassostreae]AOZ94431.1 hypothetical protein LPB68_20975 [Paenibacillus crassostreae]OAB76532.1 hypothetical protein PNBC_03765 [Paenibacillus crassostreae]
MKIEEEYVGRGPEFASLLRSIADRIDGNNLTVRGNPVILPEQDLEYKINLKTDLGKNKFNISIEWLDK